MKNYDVKQALSIIVKAAKEYNEKLNNDPAGIPDGKTEP